MATKENRKIKVGLISHSRKGSAHHSVDVLNFQPFQLDPNGQTIDNEQSTIIPGVSHNGSKDSFEYEGLRFGLPPKPLGDTFNPKLDVTTASLPPQPVYSPTPIVPTLISDTENSTNQSNSQEEPPIFLFNSVGSPRNGPFASQNGSNCNLSSSQKWKITSNPLASTNITPPIDIQDKTEHNEVTSSDQGSNKNDRRHQRNKLHHKMSINFPIVGRKSKGAWTWAKKVEAELETTQYPPITLSVPALSDHVWKYPSGALKGTALCQVYEDFVRRNL